MGVFFTTLYHKSPLGLFLYRKTRVVGSGNKWGKVGEGSDPFAFPD